LPDDGVPHDRGRGGEIAPDGREVERRDGVYEPLERAKVEVVPHAGHRERLVGVTPLRLMDIEAVEVDQFAGRIDLRLMRRLRLAEHGGRVDDSPMPRGEQIRGLEKDRCAALELPRRPLPPRVARGGDRCLHFPRTGLVHLGDDVMMAVGHDDVGSGPGAHLAAGDDQRDVERPTRQVLEGPLQLGALRGAGRVAQDGLVDGRWDPRSRVHVRKCNRRKELSSVYPLMAIHPQTRIGHVHLTVSDLDRALAFYRDVLGFEVTTTYGRDAVFLSAGGYHHHIGLNTWAGRGAPAPAPGATGLYHFAILFPDRKSLAA